MITGGELPTSPVAERICSFEGCSTRVLAKALCRSHYNKQWFARSPGARAMRKANKRERYRKSPSGAAHSRLRRNKERLLDQLQRPVWAERKEMLRWYIDRPGGMDVDHIIPLRHPLVCGLDTPDNYQYLSSFENRHVKKNQFDGTHDNLSWLAAFEDHVPSTLARELAADFPDQPD